MNLNSPLERISGVGPKTAEWFAGAAINTVGDILDFLPKKYDDFSSVQSISDIKPGQVTIQVTCRAVQTKVVRRGMTITSAELYDETDSVLAVWFNQPYRAKQLSQSKQFSVSGVYEFSHGRYQIVNPSVELVDGSHVNSGRVLPIYRAVSGIKPAVFRKVLMSLRPFVDFIEETLPQNVVENEKLVSRKTAIRIMHFPENTTEIAQAKERLAFEELFWLLLASKLNKIENTKLIGRAIAFDQSLVKQFVGSLPFQLTNAQRRAAWDILSDISKPTPMNRILQGDVGSGKTVVASIAALQVASRGLQTAIMAPTEILASQHAETLHKMLSGHGVGVAFLSGSIKGKKRELIYSAIAKGEVDVVVGTHALITAKVQYANLGLAIIDEQHRFGVKQRQALMDKSNIMPHMLTMTATPIPRSLALTLFGELDVSVLDELPASRRPIETSIWPSGSREQLYRLVDGQIEQGRQVYVICRAITEDVDSETKSVQAEYRRLKGTVFKHRRIEMLHGKLQPSEKEAVMARMTRGEIDILISTTVVEVGVDIPNATVMIIEDADFFGLAQLHQLRGRVGRGEHQSYCYLVPQANRVSKRLREIEKSTDGFYLAEVDLKMRGPGEVYGRMQHGVLNMQVASLADSRLIHRVAHSVDEFIKSNDDVIKYKQLTQQVTYYQRLTTLN
jgi:ATP-dependent DNA helicase RecG